jgi:acyl-CoA dehydrogenase
MSWDFSTEPEFETRLVWAREFMETWVYPLETLDLTDADFQKVAEPLKTKVKDAGLFAAHLPVELGGTGFGQVKLALLHEIVGRSPTIGPIIFGSQPPDSGNAELIALAGTDSQKERWLDPLLQGEIRSCFSMSEQGRGSDPTMIQTRAVRDGTEWVINGKKWFSSNGSIADIIIVMCRTNDNPQVHKRFSMILVEKDAAGMTMRDVPTMQHPVEREPSYAAETEITYEDVRVPIENLLGTEGEAFALAQRRLGPGRIHHCMRWIGQCNRAFDMLCERAVSQTLSGLRLADTQIVQCWVANSLAAIEAARLMTLRAAWKIDASGVESALNEISMIKYFGATVLHDVIDSAIQIYGSFGYSSDLPLEEMYRIARAARIYDGPDEVHQISVARRVLRGYSPVETPTEHVPTRRLHAISLFQEYLDGWEP